MTPNQVDSSTYWTSHLDQVRAQERELLAIREQLGELLANIDARLHILERVEQEAMNRLQEAR